MNWVVLVYLVNKIMCLFLHTRGVAKLLILNDCQYIQLLCLKRYTYVFDLLIDRNTVNIKLIYISKEYMPHYRNHFMLPLRAPKKTEKHICLILSRILV